MIQKKMNECQKISFHKNRCRELLNDSFFISPSSQTELNMTNMKDIESDFIYSLEILETFLYKKNKAN